MVSPRSPSVPERFHGPDMNVGEYDGGTWTLADPKFPNLRGLTQIIPKPPWIASRKPRASFAGPQNIDFSGLCEVLTCCTRFVHVHEKKRGGKYRSTGLCMKHCQNVLDIALVSSRSRKRVYEIFLLDVTETLEAMSERRKSRKRQ